MCVSSTLLFFCEAHDRKSQDYVVSFLAVMGENPPSFERGGRWRARATADRMRLIGRVLVSIPVLSAELTIVWL